MSFLLKLEYIGCIMLHDRKTNAYEWQHTNIITNVDNALQDGLANRRFFYDEITSYSMM